jgi:hypothetical protein
MKKSKISKQLAMPKVALKVETIRLIESHHLQEVGGGQTGATCSRQADVCSNSN